MIRLLLASLLLVPLLASHAWALDFQGGGGHAIQDPTGAPLPQRGILQCADNLTCEDDPGNGRTKIRALVGATTLYVCAATGAPCNASVSNAGTSPTAALPCVQDALDKLPGALTATTTIFVASGSFSCTANVIELHGYGRTAPIKIAKYVTGGAKLILRGTFNATANSFTNVPVSSGTASAAATNDYPITGAGAVGTTTFTDASKAWTVNAFVVYYLHITGGTGYVASDEKQNWYVINSNTATVLTLNTRWASTVPDSTTTYEIFSYTDQTQINSAGNTTAVIVGSDNIVLESLRLGVPTGGIGADNKTLWIWRSRLNFDHGDFGTNSHQSNGTFANYYGSQSIYAASVNSVADCGPVAYCIYDHVDMRNWQYHALLVMQNAYLWVKDSFAASGVAGNAFRGAITGIYGGSFQVEGSYLRAPAGGHGALLRDSGNATWIEKVRIDCPSTAAGNEGVLLTLGASLATEGTAHRVDTCNVGVRTGHNATFYKPTAPTYFGNTANETTSASGVVSTTLY